MNIGIYDKDTNRGNKIKRIIEDYLHQILEKEIVKDVERENINDIRIITLQNKESIDCENTNVFIYILFINLDTDGEVGIQLAKEMNRRKKGCQIIYYAESLNMVTEVYKTNHIYFVLQEQLHQRLDDIFQKIFMNFANVQERLFFTEIGGNKVFLLSEEIYYFERSKRVTRIVTVHGIYEIREKLSDIIERLPGKEFVRCHNSYIINVLAVREVKKDCLVMVNGDKVVVSRSYGKVIKETFAEKL